MKADSNTKAKGITWFLIQCFTVSVTFAVVRFAIKDINIFVMTFIQSSFAFLFFLPVALKGGVANLKTKRLSLHIVRNIFGLAGTSCAFYGATKVPLSDVTAISFTSPLFTTIAAVILLGEKVKSYRWVGMAFSFAGVLIVTNPASQFNPYTLLLILSVVLMGFVQVFIAKLNKTEPVIRIMFFMISLTVIMTAPLAAANWVMPHWQNIAWILLLTVLIFINVIGMVLAYRYAEINMLMPLDFSRLIFATAAGYLIFSEAVEVHTILGSVVILGGILYALHHERRQHKTIPEL